MEHSCAVFKVQLVQWSTVVRVLKYKECNGVLLVRF